MDRETNIESIRILEEEIKEHERAAVRLKRARNSLLNVSKLPPEVLGNIFRWNVIPNGDFDGLEMGSYNFLLVCHHWFEVASRTPELWSFWGNTTKDWSRRYRRSGTAPLDLVLGEYGCNERYFDDTLCGALEDRAANDAIRRVHLLSGDAGLVGSILNALTPNCEDLRSNGVESFILWNHGKVPADVSDFFAHYRFPKLQRLNLVNCSVSSWDHLTSRTSVLTTLELELDRSSPTPTTSQLLSILSSNPVLQKVALLRRAVPDDDGGDKLSSRVQLHHLKELRLNGSLRHVFNLLQQLDHPRNMDLLSLTLFGCDDVGVSQVVGPHLRDHLQRRDRAQNGLSLSVSSGNHTYAIPHIAFSAGDAGGIDFSAPTQSQMRTFVVVTMLLEGFSRDEQEKAALGLIACVPREQVVYFKTQTNPAGAEDMYAQFPNVRALSFDNVPLSAAFPNPNLAGDGRIFSSLEHVLLERVVMDYDGDWTPLVTFLACLMSSGNRLDTLVVADSPLMFPEVVMSIRGLVRDLKINVSLLGARPEP